MSSASGLACYRKNGQRLCACGCGMMTWRTWAAGHHRKARRRPDDPRYREPRPCACGCQGLTRWTWVAGHQNRSQRRAEREVEAARATFFADKLSSLLMAQRPEERDEPM